MTDELSPSLTDLARRPTGGEQWQQAIARQQQQRQRYGSETQQRLGGLAPGLADVANMAWEASLPAHLRNMYQHLQAGAAPEQLAGMGMDAALRMLDYGVAMPGSAGMPRNALGSLTLRQRDRFETHGPFGGGYIRRSFHMVNEKGEPVGRLYTTYDPYERNLHIGLMETDLPAKAPVGSQGLYANPHTFALGPGELESLGPEIKREWPMAKTISFQRESGATSVGKSGEPRTIKRQLPWAEDEGWIPSSLRDMKS